MPTINSISLVEEVYFKSHYIKRLIRSVDDKIIKHFMIPLRMFQSLT